MKVRFYRWYSAILTALLSMLGFNACNLVSEYGAPTVEYGGPPEEYEDTLHIDDQGSDGVNQDIILEEQ